MPSKSLKDWLKGLDFLSPNMELSQCWGGYLGVFVENKPKSFGGKAGEWHNMGSKSFYKFPHIPRDQEEHTLRAVHMLQKELRKP